MKLLALGDLALRDVPGNSAGAVFGELLPYLERADLRTVNLEAQFATVPAPEWMAGRGLRASPAGLPVLTDAGIDVVNIANNHALDIGPAGLTQSLAALADIGVDVCGLSRADDVPMTIKTVHGIRIGFLGGCDDYEPLPPTAPDHERAGAPLPCTDEVLEQHVATLHRDVDVLVVHLHWGYEFSLYPLAEHQARARQIVARGADLVICHHAHVPQGVERYGRGVIAYGLGNAWMPMVPYLVEGHPWTHRSFALEAECTADGVAAVRLIPFEIRSSGGLAVLQGEPASRLLADVARISGRLRDGAFLRRLERARVAYELVQAIATIDEAVARADLLLLRRARKLALPRQKRLMAHARDLPGCRPLAEVLDTLSRAIGPPAIRSTWDAARGAVAEARSALLREYRWRDALLARTP